MSNGESRSGWVTAGAGFAGAILIMVGVFQVIDGLQAIINDEFFVRAPHYTYHLDVTGYGWIHLIIGVLMLWMGIGIFQGRSWAAVGGIAVAMLSAIANFFFIPYYPFWAILIIALDVWIIWALSRPQAVIER